MPITPAESRNRPERVEASAGVKSKKKGFFSSFFRSSGEEILKYSKLSYSFKVCGFSFRIATLMISMFGGLLIVVGFYDSLNPRIIVPIGICLKKALKIAENS